MESDINKTMKLLSLLEISESAEQTGKNELETLAHAIVDLTGAGSKLSKFCAKIRSGELSTKDEMDDVFTEILTELSHIVYHIADSKYLSPILIPYIDDKD